MAGKKSKEQLYLCAGTGLSVEEGDGLSAGVIHAHLADSPAAGKLNFPLRAADEALPGLDAQEFFEGREARGAQFSNAELEPQNTHIDRGSADRGRPLLTFRKIGHFTKDMMVFHLTQDLPCFLDQQGAREEETEGIVERSAFSIDIGSGLEGVAFPPEEKQSLRIFVQGDQIRASVKNRLYLIEFHKAAAIVWALDGGASGIGGP